MEFHQVCYLVALFDIVSQHAEYHMTKYNCNCIFISLLDHYKMFSMLLAK